MSKIIKKILKETPLKTRLYVLNSMSMSALLVELGYREDKPWGDDEEEIAVKLDKYAKKITRWQLEDIKKWEKDGKP